MKFFSNLFWSQLMGPRGSRIRLRKGVGHNLARFEPACQLPRRHCSDNQHACCFPSSPIQRSGNVISFLGSDDITLPLAGVLGACSHFSSLAGWDRVSLPLPLLRRTPHSPVPSP